MSTIESITLANGHMIYVEMETAEIPATAYPKPSDLPEGAEEVSKNGKVIDAMEAMKNNIEGLAETVYKSLHASQPDEWSMEVNIGFKGKTSPIPIILSGEASTSIKVTAKWKKNRWLTGKKPLFKYAMAIPIKAESISVPHLLFLLSTCLLPNM